MEHAAAASVPSFQVGLQPPDLAPWRAGNQGVPGFTTLSSGQPGPHVAVVALTHGNELAGAIVLDSLLRAGLRPARGMLSLGFANLAAMDRFDPRHPTASRFVDEDLNRVWDDDLLNGSRRSLELDRARIIRPLLGQVDILLDLHSMLWPSDPLMLCGPSDKGRLLAARIGTPGLVVADAGHASGKRLIDHSGFTGRGTHRAAVLVEAGQHWEAATVASTRACVAALLHATFTLDRDNPWLPPPPPGAPAPRFAAVTDAITATTASFAFVRPFRGGEIIPRANTLIAQDGGLELRTPYDDCLLVMPGLRPSRGHTAVRLARFG